MEADGNFVNHTKCTDLENVSTMVRIVLLPAEECSPVTKTNAICDQGTGKGWRRPDGGWYAPCLGCTPYRLPRKYRHPNPSPATRTDVSAG